MGSSIISTRSLSHNDRTQLHNRSEPAKPFAETSLPSPLARWVDTMNPRRSAATTSISCGTCQPAVDE